VNPPDASRIAMLAQHLQLTPRQLLVLAARLVDAPRPLAGATLDAEAARVRASGEAAEAVADLALLGYAAFALDDIEHGLMLAGAPTRVEGL
jgi:hypothetical protein